ncbi:hypothetical protein M885DRAFT_511345 [Pelagophyceae sp. CCMP2097]|nr:hypothetical protein M885DRAFT_511345 [Pelagophyceae sp. CCMP2097]
MASQLGQFWPAGAPGKGAKAKAAPRPNAKKKGKAAAVPVTSGTKAVASKYNTDYSRFDVDDSDSDADRADAAPSLQRKLEAKRAPKANAASLRAKPTEADALRELGSRISELSVAETRSALNAARAELEAVRAEAEVARAHAEKAAAVQSKRQNDLSTAQTAAADAKLKADAASASLDVDEISAEMAQGAAAPAAHAKVAEVAEAAAAASPPVEPWRGTVEVVSAAFVGGVAAVRVRVDGPELEDELLLGLHVLRADGDVDDEALAFEYWPGATTVTLAEAAAACDAARHAGEPRPGTRTKCVGPTRCAVLLANATGLIVAEAPETVEIDWRSKTCRLLVEAGSEAAAPLPPPPPAPVLPFELYASPRAAFQIEDLPGIKCFSLTSLDLGAFSTTRRWGDVLVNVPADLDASGCFLRPAHDHVSARLRYTRKHPRIRYETPTGLGPWTLDQPPMPFELDKSLDGTLAYACGFCAHRFTAALPQPRRAPSAVLAGLGECADEMGLSAQALRDASVPRLGSPSQNGIAVALDAADLLAGSTAVEPQHIFAPQMLEFAAEFAKAHSLNCGRCGTEVGIAFGSPTSLKTVALYAHRLRLSSTSGQTAVQLKHGASASSFVAALFKHEYATRHAVQFLLAARETRLRMTATLISADSAVGSSGDFILRPALKVAFRTVESAEEMDESEMRRIELHHNDFLALKRDLESSTQSLPPSLANVRGTDSLAFLRL